LEKNETGKESKKEKIKCEKSEEEKELRMKEKKK